MWIIPDLMTETDRIQASLSHGLIRIIPMSILFSRIPSMLAFDDTIRPRYFLSLGKLQRPLQLRSVPNGKIISYFIVFGKPKTVC